MNAVFDRVERPLLEAIVLREIAKSCACDVAFNSDLPPGQGERDPAWLNSIMDELDWQIAEIRIKLEIARCIRRRAERGLARQGQNEGTSR